MKLDSPRGAVFPGAAQQDSNMTEYTPFYLSKAVTKGKV